MQQPVNAAQVDERAVFGKVLDYAYYHRAFEKMFQSGVLADVDLLFHRQFSRHHHVAAAPVELDDLDWNILAGQRIEIVYGPWIGLRPRHECLDADIHREAALDPAQHAAGEDQLILKCLVQVIPDAQARGARMRKQHVALGLLAAVLDHHVDSIAHMNGKLARVGLELLNGNKAFALVAEVDDDVFAGNTENPALQNFVGGGRSKMRIILKKILIILGDRLIRLRVFVNRHCASACH